MCTSTSQSRSAGETRARTNRAYKIPHLACAVRTGKKQEFTNPSRHYRITEREKRGARGDPAAAAVRRSGPHPLSRLGSLRERLGRIRMRSGWPMGGPGTPARVEAPARLSASHDQLTIPRYATIGWPGRAGLRGVEPGSHARHSSHSSLRPHTRAWQHSTHQHHLLFVTAALSASRPSHELCGST